MSRPDGVVVGMKLAGVTRDETSGNLLTVDSVMCRANALIVYDLGSHQMSGAVWGSLESDMSGTGRLIATHQCVSFSRARSAGTDSANVDEMR
jgi:hypothetical protein